MITTRQRGFTLLEVLVAMTVLAIGLGAVIKVAAESASNTGYLRDQTLALWVARNQINEQLLDREFPATGSRKGSVSMAERDWRWQLEISDTDDDDLRRLDIEVSADQQQSPLIRLSAFKRRL